jgi:hypothetical protein
MKHAALAVIPALLITSACESSRPRAASASHPPIADLTCPDEPDVVAALAADPSGVTFDVAVRKAGQDCRDALARVCRWHKERGADVTCPVAIKEPR